MNHLRVEQQARVHQIEVLQEEAYKVKMTLRMTQGIIKQAAEEGVEKVQAHVTAETIDHFL
jgi:hypothetical protein